MIDDDEVDGRPVLSLCERCHQERPCQDIPFMGYSLFLCEACAALAYHREEAV